MSATREQEYYVEVRQLNRTLWDTINALKAKQPEWQALEYGVTLDNGAGGNAGLTKDDIGAVVFATTDAIVDLLGQGFATNIAKLL